MSDTAAFTEERPRLIGVAYRMLGSVAEAEDVVQDAWLRWRSADGVREPRSYLTTVVVRLALDRLKSAQRRREQYIGPWLPEPWIGVTPPEDPVLASSLSFALLRLLETLTPPQRAAFVLRDVFDHDYTDVAEILEVSRDNARQLVRRARQRLQDPPRFSVDAERHQQLVLAFGAAAMQGDLDALEGLLAEDAIAWSDGGGQGKAARVPIVGGPKIGRAYRRFVQDVPEGASLEPVWVNGFPGVVTRVDGRVLSVHVVEIVEERIAAIYAVLAPDKLRHVR